MTNKPTTAEGYAGGYTDLVRETCLYVATKLGDLMDYLVVVGGLVPTLLIERDPSSAEAPREPIRRPLLLLLRRSQRGEWNES